MSKVPTGLSLGFNLKTGFLKNFAQIIFQNNKIQLKEQCFEIV